MQLGLRTVGRARIRNENVIVSNKTQLKMFDDLVCGHLVASDTVEIECQNGPVTLDCKMTGGGKALSVCTTNNELKGEFESAGGLRVATTNGALSGKFTAAEDIVVEGSQGRIE